MAFVRFLLFEKTIINSGKREKTFAKEIIPLLMSFLMYILCFNICILLSNHVGFLA